MIPDSERFLFASAVHLFLWRDGQVLLSRRFNTGYEDGETVVMAAVREGEEEAGVRIAPEDIEVVGVMHRKAGDTERIDWFVSVSRWGGEVTNCEPDRCDDLRWSPPDALPENTIPYIRQALENDKKGIWYCSFGI